jgi:hypothetical protein
MAERHLYNNLTEPEFPFDLIRPQLDPWLPQYLVIHHSDRDYDEPLLNTVLTFGRARTSTLLHSGNLERVKALLDHLNSAARAVGATHHLLEIDDAQGMFFVVCRRSPRYKWTRPLTHFDIGRNLDFFAPGHFGRDPNLKVCHVSFVERGRMGQLTGEGVRLEALQDPLIVKDFHEYNKSRETLYNSVMEQFGLEYRFKCVIQTDSTLGNVAETMVNSLPPERDWWEANCLFVNGCGFPGVNVSAADFYCGFYTKYQQHWELICKTFHFVLGHNRYEFSLRGDPEVSTAYFENLHALLLRIKAVCEADGGQEYGSTVREFDVVFENLAATAASMPPKPTRAAPKRIFRPPVPTFLHRHHHITSRFLRLVLFEPFKLRPRLNHPPISPPSDESNEVVFI